MDPSKAGRLGIRPDAVRNRPTGVPTVARGAPVCIGVQVSDPTALGSLLEGHGFPVARETDGVVVALGDDRLLIRVGTSAQLIAVEPCGRVPAPAPGSDPGLLSARLAALGLATVDHERFARDHGLGPLEVGPDDDLLGARSWRPAGTERLILLEPSTEGRLAGALARSGEGPLVAYLAIGSTTDDTSRRLTALGVPGTPIGLPGRAGGAILVIVRDA